MFNHVMLGSDDLDRSKRFYDALIGTLGGSPGTTDGGGRLRYAHDGDVLMLSRPIDGAPASAANGGTLGFKASGTEGVDAWHKAGIDHGGTACEDPPGLRSNGVYLAYLRDPDGNKLCAVYRMPK